MVIAAAPNEPELLAREEGYAFVQYGKHVYGVPLHLNNADVTHPRTATLPGVVRGPSLAAVRQQVANPADVPIEFAGWLPAFQWFGNCGQHPQFAHADVPPPGYRFVRNPPPPSARWARWGRLCAATGRIVRKAGALLGRPFASLASGSLRYGPGPCLRTLVAMARLTLALRRRGCRMAAILRFLRTRHFPSQVMLPRRPALLFLTSIPFTYGQHPWVIEIEDVTTLFFPFIHNGKTAGLDVAASPYHAIIKAMLESASCRGIITHMRSTAEALPRLFASATIAQKVSHVPCGVKLPDRWQTHEESEHLDLLFTCSWHQDPASFFLRGGLEVLRALEVLQERYPHIRLTLRTGLPQLRAPYRRILEKCWVRVIDRFLPDAEMDALMRRTHVFLLPAARIHIVSVLKAMAYGQVVVASDGWGFGEYLEHGRNSLIVPGRYGKASWEDPDTGMLREDYRPMAVAHPRVVCGLVDVVSMLAEDRALRQRLSGAARHDVATRYSLTEWNRGLKQALDQATATRPGT